MLTVDQSVIIGAICQALLYGLYVATSLHCLRWLLYNDEGWSQRKDINWPMLTIAVAIFVFSTASVGMVLQNVFAESNQIAIANYAMELALIVTTDAVLIYRCWSIYSHSWRIVIPPLILWLGGIVCMVLILYLLPFSDPAHLLQRHTSWETFYSCNIALNIYATTAMVYRILTGAKRTNGVSGRLYYNICRILTESGVLFAISSLTNLIALITDTNPYGANIPRKLFNAINVSMAGIAFNLILIRLGQERTNAMQVYPLKTGPASALRTDSATAASSQAQTCDTVCPEKEDQHGIKYYPIAKVES